MEFDNGGGFGGGSAVGASGIPDMDSLFQMAVDDASVRQTMEDVLKPAGSYVTTPVLNLTAGRHELGKGSIRPDGLTDRLVFRFFGPAQMTVTEKNSRALGLGVGTIVKGQFGFAVSPERANKLKDNVDSGEPDTTSQRWAQAVKAYETAYKTKPGTIGDVVRYLQNYAVVVRVIQVGVASERFPEPDGEPGNIVMAISPVREVGTSL